MRRIVFAFAFVAATFGLAGANGRPAATSTINFQQGNPQHIVAGMTFGLTISDDGGATWYWMCEKAVGYGGMYDPDYAYTSSGAIFATTFDGLKVMRDRCVFKCALGAKCQCSADKMPCTVDNDCSQTPSPQTCTSEFVSQEELSPDHSLSYAAADPMDATIYKSANDGMSFPTMAMPGLANDWWDSLVVAPSDSTRIYLSGYRLVGQNPKQFLLFRSDNGGTSYTAMSTTGFTTNNNSSIDIVGVDRTNPDLVYAKVTLENGQMGDGLYKSTNAGASWSKILDMEDPFGLVFLARSNGELIAATQTLGTKRSAGGASCTNEATCNWTALTTPPHINCLAENPATLATTHEVWACTHNFDSPGIPGDGFGIMKTTDLAAWTGVLRFQDIKAPVDCPVGTAQRDQCVESFMAKPSVWCCLEMQLGITSTAIECTGARDCGLLPDSPPDAGGIVNPPKKGCCQTGGSGAGALLLALGVGAILYRRRRPRD